MDQTVFCSFCHHTAFMQQSSVFKVFRDSRFIKYSKLRLIIKLCCPKKYAKYQSFSFFGDFFSSKISFFCHHWGVGVGYIQPSLWPELSKLVSTKLSAWSRSTTMFLAYKWSLSNNSNQFLPIKPSWELFFDLFGH